MYKISFKPKLPKILFRADSSAKIGHGHRTRVESLARFVASQGCDYLIASKNAIGAKPDVSDLNKILWLPSELGISNNFFSPLLDAKDMMEIVASNQFSPNIIIADGYNFGSSWELFLRDCGFYVVALDDFRNNDHSANLVFEFLPPPCAPSRLCGLGYIPVDDKFVRDKPPTLSYGYNVLVSFGGTDPSNFIDSVLVALDLVAKHIPNFIRFIDIVLPQSLKGRERLPPTSFDERLSLHFGLPSLAPLMHKCEIVITSGGNTMIESIVAKRLCFVIITADNQKIMSNYLENQSLIQILGFANNVKISTIVDKFINLTSIFQPRMSTALKKSTIDSKGSERLFSTIYSKWNSTFKHAN